MEQQVAIQDQVHSPPDGGIIRVGGSSNPQSVGSVLARTVLAGNTDVVLRCVGASAVNQAAKSVGIARGFVAPRGHNLLVAIGFADVEGTDGKPISAIIFKPVLL